VFFSAKPESMNSLNGNNKDIADWIAEGNLGLGYSTGLQVVGIVASIIGGVLAFTGDFGPTGAR